MKGLLKFTLLLCILKSMNYWVFWNFNTRYVYILTLLSILICIIHKKKQIWKSKIKGNYSLGFIFLIIFAFFQNSVSLSSNANILSYSNTILYLGIFYCVLHFNEDFKDEIISFTEKAMIILLVPAIIIFLLRFVVSLPYIPMLYTDSFGNEPYGLLQNYIFLIHHAEAIADLATFPRFCGPFLEPGQLATFLAFLLYVLKFDFSKKSRYVLLIALLFSFSLAGYVLALIGAIMQKSNSIKKFIPLIFIIGITYVVGKNYNNGDNLLNNYILVRLEYDEEKGIAGNDRSSTIADDIFENYVLTNTEYLLFGCEKYRGVAIGGSGYVLYIINYGIFSLIFIILFYSFTSYGAKNRKEMTMLFILVVLSFLQRATPLIFYIPFLYLLSLDKKILLLQKK